MTYTEFGIQLPNGQTQWGNFLGRSLASEQDRALMSLVLHKTAEELGWPEDEFMNRFRWVPREVTPSDNRYMVDDPSVAPPLGQTIPNSLPEPEPIKESEPRHAIEE